ncbi:MAG TPA: S41 family peptidase [Pirellulaceae bacterium]|nr:S41 family peptidase [Pirellulaceae bacterium]
MPFRAAVKCLLLAAIASCGSLGNADETPKAQLQEQEEYHDLLELFVETFNEVDRNYAETINRRELMEAAIEGMISKLDKHSHFIPPAELEEFRRGVDSEFGGIGVQVVMDGGQLTIISPIVDSPAYRANLIAGDVITHIDGTATGELTLSNAVQLLKGKLGTSVVLTIRHPDSEAVDTVTIVRESVRIETVRGDRRRQDDSWDYMYDHELGIGYVRIVSFSRYTVRELRATMNALMEQSLKGLILDLRSNPGGLLSSAIEVSDMFVNEGVIVTTSGRNIDSRDWRAHKSGTYSGFPMAVLVNRFSASASEIVAACLQDHERAVVVGQRTWGKGSVQNILDLEQGRSALKLTTAEYHRPTGKNIDRKPDAAESEDWGVRPNEGFEFQMSDSEAARLERLRQSKDLLSKRVPAEEMEDRQFDIALKYMIGEVAKAHSERVTATSNK